MLRAFAHRVAMCCDMLGVVGSSLKMVKFEPTAPNMSQHGGQTHAPCCAQQCCDMLRWHVAIVWLGLYNYSNINLPDLLCWDERSYRSQHVIQLTSIICTCDCSCLKCPYCQNLYFLIMNVVYHLKR